MWTCPPQFVSILLGCLLGLDSGLNPVVGAKTTYTAKSGESLYRIARDHNVSETDLMLANGLTRSRLKAGTKLLLPTQHILPKTPSEGVVLNLPERAVYIFRDGKFRVRLPCAVGRPY